MTDKYRFPDGRLSSSYATEYHPLEKDLLYHELSRNRFDEFHRKKSTLYLIVKTGAYASFDEAVPPAASATRDA